MTPVRLLIVTDLQLADEASTGRTLERALSVDGAEGIAVGVRDHDAPDAQRIAFARALLPIVRRRGARLLVHDRVDIARTIGADGVQLGSRSVPAGEARAVLGSGTLIGRSCHDADELARAAAEGADFATLSPLFASPGKGVPLGLATFRSLRATVPTLRVLALGGIDVQNVHAAREAGADGVAVIRAVLRAPDPAAVVDRLLGKTG